MMKNKNSIGFYIESLGFDLDKVWDFEKNTKNPDEVTKMSNVEIWLKCVNHDYHGSYKTTAKAYYYSSSTEGYGCPYCSKISPNRKVHILDSFAYKHQDWAKWWDSSNKKTPFECKGNEQHETFKFTCPICGYSFESTLMFLSDLKFKHVCESDKTRGKGYDEYQDYRKQQQFERAAKHIKKSGKGEWELIEFNGTNRPGTVKHHCGATKTVTRISSLYNKNIVCPHCDK